MDTARAIRRSSAAPMDVYPDGLAGIAVPLADRTRVHGVINIVWAKSAREIDDMVRNHLADLQTAASDIVESLRYQMRRMYRAA
jgi:DNA-binding IclR family transcriptional regulator